MCFTKYRSSLQQYTILYLSEMFDKNIPMVILVILVLKEFWRSWIRWMRQNFPAKLSQFLTNSYNFYLQVNNLLGVREKPKKSECKVLISNLWRVNFQSQVEIIVLRQIVVIFKIC